MLVDIPLPRSISFSFPDETNLVILVLVFFFIFELGGFEDILCVLGSWNIPAFLLDSLSEERTSLHGQFRLNDKTGMENNKS